MELMLILLRRRKMEGKKEIQIMLVIYRSVKSSQTGVKLMESLTLNVNILPFSKEAY